MISERARLYRRVSHQDGTSNDELVSEGPLIFLACGVVRVWPDALDQFHIAAGSAVYVGEDIADLVRSWFERDASEDADNEADCRAPVRARG